MKVGIVTFHNAQNYGAMLQAYGVRRALEDLGHDPVFVHYLPDFALKPKHERTKGRGLRSIPRRLMLAVARPWLKRRHERFVAFRDEYFPLTRRYRSEQEVRESPPDADAYVCGSDQIWNLEAAAPMPFLFLEFAPDTARLVSYAPSFGNPMIPRHLREIVRSWLSRFHALSVREADGCVLVRELLERPVQQVLDPVFLIGNEEWDSLAVNPGMGRPYIAFYSLETSPRTNRLITHLARELGLPVVVLGKLGAFRILGQARIAIDSGPREFLGWIRNATMVVTNSFHATAFAAKFGVPFITIAHSTRNSRMEDLLGQMGEEWRIVHDVQDLGDPQRFCKAPTEAALRITPAVERSRAFLRDALTPM